MGCTITGNGTIFHRYGTQDFERLDWTPKCVICGGPHHVNVHCVIAIYHTPSYKGDTQVLDARIRVAE